MNYVELKFQVPEGYEEQVKQLVFIKIEGILSQILLNPSVAKKAEFDAEVLKIKADLDAAVV